MTDPLDNPKLSELMLRNAHRIHGKKYVHKDSPLWSLVSEITGHGSTMSREICVALGWDPERRCGDPLPVR